jgi:vitamin B12 transport system ATP-binding protein
VAQQRAVDTLLEQLRQAGMAVVASGHDLNHSLRHADRVWLMHQGTMVAQGTADSVLTAEQLGPLYQIDFLRIETPQGALLLVS